MGFLMLMGVGIVTAGGGAGPGSGDGLLLETDLDYLLLESGDFLLLEA